MVVAPDFDERYGSREEEQVGVREGLREKDQNRLPLDPVRRLAVMVKVA